LIVRDPNDHGAADTAVRHLQSWLRRYSSW
jgi:hypothetical protein